MRSGLTLPRTGPNLDSGAVARNVRRTNYLGAVDATVRRVRCRWRMIGSMGTSPRPGSASGVPAVVAGRDDPYALKFPVVALVSSLGGLDALSQV
jgi:hypothetical protein